VLSFRRYWAIQDRIGVNDSEHSEHVSRQATKTHLVYRFGKFELDPVRETLNGPDGPVLLRDHALRVLKLLIERSPGIVSRDEILDAVWGHQALSESSIAQVIRDIRSTLGDLARPPTMVATRYGRGYQFIGDLERVEQEADPPSAPPPSRATDRRSPSTIPRTLLIGLIAVLAIAGSQWFRGAPTMPVADAGTITLRAITPESGDGLSQAFVDYLAFLLGNALGSDRVEIARSKSDLDSADRVIEVSLASLETGNERQLELAIGESVADNTEFRLRFDEARELVGRGMDEVLRSIERNADAEVRLDAGLISQSSFAVETLLRGMAAQFAGEVPRAIELFEAALAEDPDFEFARYELAIAVRRSGQFERALAILEPMAQRLASNFWVQRINNAMGIAYWRLNRFDEALDALRRAESVADSPTLRAITLTNISLIERKQGFLAQAEVSIREAIRLAVEGESPRLQASARNTLASILTRLDRHDEALVQLGLARELFYETGNLAGYAAVLSRTARIRAARGERSETESLLRLALGVREQIGDDDGVADLQLRLARIHRVRGEFEQARILARNGLDRAQALGEDDLVIDAYQALAALALADRRYDQARSYGNEALRLAELTGRERDTRAVRLGLLSVDLETTPSPGTLEAHLDQLVDDADAADDRLVAIRARLLAARLYRQLQRPNDARRVLDRSLELLEPEDARFANEVNAARARLALELGDPDAASQALDAMEQRNSPDFPTLMLRARVHAARGNFKAAVEIAGLALANTGDWWRPEDQALLDIWSSRLQE